MAEGPSQRITITVYPWSSKTGLQIGTKVSGSRLPESKLERIGRLLRDTTESDDWSETKFIERVKARLQSLNENQTMTADWILAKDNKEYYESGGGVEPDDSEWYVVGEQADTA